VAVSFIDGGNWSAQRKPTTYQITSDRLLAKLMNYS
jgi:hypothetical protein